MDSSLCVQVSWQASVLQGIEHFGEVSGFYRCICTGHVQLVHPHPCCVAGAV